MGKIAGTLKMRENDNMWVLLIADV